MKNSKHTSNKSSAKESTKSPKPSAHNQPKPYYMTSEEIESLRRDKQQASAKAKELIKADRKAEKDKRS